MKVWKVQETIVSDDKDLADELNRLELIGAKTKEIMLTHKLESSVTLYVYKIIYTIEDEMLV